MGLFCVKGYGWAAVQFLNRCELLAALNPNNTMGSLSPCGVLRGCLGSWWFRSVLQNAIAHWSNQPIPFQRRPLVHDTVVCTGGKVLMTIRIRADGNPSENSWKLFSGRGTEGTLL